MSSCRNSKHFHLNIPPLFRRTRASLSARTHTPLISTTLNYVRRKNCVSVFRIRPYTPRTSCRNIVLSLSLACTYINMPSVLFHFFYLLNLYRVLEDARVSVRISIAGLMNFRNGFCKEKLIVCFKTGVDCCLIRWRRYSRDELVARAACALIPSGASRLRQTGSSARARMSSTNH